MTDPCEDDLKRQIEELVQTLGEDHPDVVRTLNDLAKLYWNKALYSQAEPLYKRALAIHKQLLGPDHPSTAVSLNNLAELYRSQGLYSQAEPLYQRALAIMEQVLGPDHPETASSINNQALLYTCQGLYSQAEPLFQRALAIREQVLGPVHPDTATSLDNLAWLYWSQGLYSQAEPLYQRALAIRERVLGPDHPDTATSLNNLAQLYKSQGQYSQVEPLFQRALAIREQVLGPDHLDTATSLDNLAGLYWSQGFYSQAESFYQRALAIHEQVLGPDHPSTGASLNNLAGLYWRQGIYSQAEPLYQRALAISEQVLGPDHPSTATSLDNLAGLYCSQALYSKAEPLYKRALATREQVLGPDHPCTVVCLNSLAQLYESQGHYSLAEALFLRTLGIIEQVLGQDHPDTAGCLDALARLYLSKGLYSQAEPLYQRALAISEQVLGPDHPSTATSLNNLAQLYKSQGLYRQAESHFQRALAISEQVLGPDHPDTAASLNSLAGLYTDQGRYNQAEPLYRRALAIREQVLGPDHPSTATSLNNLALLYTNQGLYSQAEPLYQRALAISEQVLGPDHPDTGASLNNLAELYRSQGLYSQADPLYKRALAISEQVLGPDHPHTETSLNNLAWLYTAWHKYSIAIPFFAASTRSQLSWLHREAPLMATANRKQLLSIHKGLESLPLELVNEDSQFPPLFLFARLNRHGLLQQIEQRQAQLAKLPGSHQLLVERLQAVVYVLASTQLDPDRRQAVTAERDQLQAQLYRLLPDLQIKTVEVSDVAAALPSDAALIEFQRYIPRTAVESEAGTSPQFMAFILWPEGRIEAIDLGPAAPLEAAIEEAIADTVDCFADAVHAWCALSERLLPPLLSHLRGCNRWYVSLDGELHRVPFHALPLPKQPDQRLVETVELRLVTSGRDLLDHHRIPESISSAGPGLVVADPSFDQSPGSSSQEPLDIASRQWRSRDMGALTVWKPLPGTAKEGKQLAELLGASLRTGEAATTLAVQQAQRPRVLHIATHGFFLPDQTEPPGKQPWLPSEGHDLLARFRGEDPMLRSGLVLAGANHPVFDPEDDDGYLTAQEAVHVDLQGTELVTLSACDAGRGDIHAGEGVYGLQRALIIAGARSMLLSLWQVPDEATCEFMVRFYTLLKQGAGRYEALVAVQREFRHHDNVVWRHPYYWGAWQLIGDWRLIEGL